MRIKGIFAIEFDVNSEAIKELMRHGSLSESHAYSPSEMRFSEEMVSVEKPSSRFCGKILGVRLTPTGRWGRFTVRIDAEGDFAGAYCSLFGGDFTILPDQDNEVESSLYRGEYKDYRRLREEAHNALRSEQERAHKAMEEAPDPEHLFQVCLHKAFGGAVIEINGNGDSFPGPWRILSIGSKTFAIRAKFA